MQEDKEKEFPRDKIRVNCQMERRRGKKKERKARLRTLAHTVCLPSGTFVNCEAFVNCEERKRENNQIKELPLVSAAIRYDFNDSDLDTHTVFLYHNIVRKYLKKLVQGSHTDPCRWIKLQRR